MFDGDCSFCTTTASWAERRLDGAATVVAWQFLELEPLGLTVEDVTTAAYWVDADGRLHRGHLAVARVLQAMGRPWSLVGGLIPHRPVSWLAAAAYHLVARYRHRLPGGTPACKLG